jgi:hypothetical protein
MVNFRALGCLALCGLACAVENNKAKLAEYSATLDVLTQQLIAKTDEVAKQEIELRSVFYSSHTNAMH